MTSNLISEKIESPLRLERSKLLSFGWKGWLMRKKFWLIPIYANAKGLF